MIRYCRLLFVFFVLSLALLFTRSADAQGPAPAPPSAPPPSSDAGVGESAYGCVESVPKGATAPILFDAFPQRGVSGWAATLSITIRHGKGEIVLPSGFDLSGTIEAKKVLKDAGFTVPDQDGGAGAQIWIEPDDPQKVTATTHLELPLVLLPPEPGRNRMLLPPLPVAVRRANGEIATVCTHPHPIVVEDPTANTPNAMPKLNPRAIPQREEWTSLKKALGWISLGLVVGTILAYLIWKKVNQPKPVPPPPPPRPPWEVALEELDEVRHAGLLEVDRFGEYFDRTSDALRRYLGARFGFDGLESTTDEILASLKKQAGGFIRFDDPAATATAAFPDGRLSRAPSPGVSFEKVARFLRDCDLVKFANLTPTPEQCATSITQGESIVRGTMPTSMGGGSGNNNANDDEIEARLIDPVARAGLRAPLPPLAIAPKRPRSPYEPPDANDDAPTASVIAPPADDETPNTLRDRNDDATENTNKNKGGGDS